MKKVIALFTILLFTTTQFSYSQTSKKVPTEKYYLKILDLKKLFEIGKSLKPSVEKYNFYKHLYYAYTYDMLKNSTDPEINQIKRYPENVIKEIARIIVPDDIDTKEYTITNEDLDAIDYDGFKKPSLRVRMQRLDLSLKMKDPKMYSKLQNLIVSDNGTHTNVDKVNGEFVTLFSYCPMGSGNVFQCLYYKNGKITDLGYVYDYLNESELESLEQSIKSKVREYDYLSVRSRKNIVKMKNGNYKVSFSALKIGDGACCPSIEVSYETKDFKTIIPNSITAK